MPNNRGGTAEVTPFFGCCVITWAKVNDAAFPELGTKYHFRERYCTIHAFSWMRLSVLAPDPLPNTEMAAYRTARGACARNFVP